MTGTDLEKPKREVSETRRERILRSRDAWAVRHWWQRLSLSPEELKKKGLPPGWSKGVRAELRRCDRPEVAMLTEGFRHLWVLLEPEKPEGASYIWAGVAMVLAELRDEKPGITLATELGKRKGETSKPRMSELRFQQLMECHSFEELVLRLRRALAFVDKKGVSAVHLAADILQWQAENGAPQWPVQPTQSLGFQWANDYFRQVAGYRADNQ